MLIYKKNYFFFRFFVFLPLINTFLNTPLESAVSGGKRGREFIERIIRKVCVRQCLEQHRPAVSGTQTIAVSSKNK